MAKSRLEYNKTASNYVCTLDMQSVTIMSVPIERCGSYSYCDADSFSGPGTLICELLRAIMSFILECIHIW